MTDTVLSRAAREGGDVRIIYMDSKGRLTQRIVRVLSLTGADMLAWCRQRRACRRFRRCGILAAEPLHFASGGKGRRGAGGIRD